MFNIGPEKLLVILVVALIVVGPQRLPELGRTLGRWLNEFRKLQDEVKDMVRFDLDSAPGEPFISPPEAPETDQETDQEADEGELEELADPTTHSERVVALADADDQSEHDAPPSATDDEDLPPTAAAE
jgi:Tat protein translocase TatB subunit